MPDQIDRYPVNPHDDVKSHAERLRELEFRLNNLEGRRPLRHTTVTDDDGNTRIETGPAAGFGTGIIIRDENGAERLSVDENGWRQPYWTTPFIAVDTPFLSVTSGSFVDVWRSQIEEFNHKGLIVDVSAIADAATTGEMRLRIAGIATTTDSFPIPSAGGGVHKRFQWLHQVTLGGGPLSVYVQARRLTGAGNVNIYEPPGCSQVTPSICTVNGL